MSERDFETDPVDPPENQGGGGTAAEFDATPTRSEADPPENQGGGGS